ncbi:MlaC/ttg2D family ABC transporter substrate-binding protein [Tropicibacter alexandrii]|uniref:MlaC/ttg2D family ABC transporter substrate-binding protein n=1 Tax=Tropicibacter alexandrii TaxID=2267683 RepID=UPI000EF54018|nr:ABC transporter substrate-binding protein [Tropicibacter alexandrii]
MDWTRRSLLTTGAALLIAGPALALTEAQASGMVGNLVNEINRVIASGKSERAMYGDFERIFKKYADTRAIAAYAMGVDGRRATNAQKKAFTDAFTGYISRKYGKRFREFIGGRLEVQGVSRNRNFYDVSTIAYLKGEAPFEVNFHVSDNNKFYNMYIEGVNMLLTERTEIGAMLDRRRGDIDALIADLRSAS